MLRLMPYARSYQEEGNYLWLVLLFSSPRIEQRRRRLR